MKSVDDEIQYERHRGKADQEPAHKTLKSVQRWQVERDDEHKVAGPVEQEEG